ncbi:hypothetical protein HQ576_06460, partial [bacterium]|nr:hypothetical protein [bacterium]
GIGSGYTNLMSHEPMDMLTNPFPKLKLRTSEWTATPLGLRSEAFPWPVGAALLATLLLPGLVRGFRRHRSCTEWYLCSYYAVMFLHGGMGGKERYVIPIIPLLFYYGALSLMALGGWLAAQRAPHGASPRGARLGRVLLVVLTLALTARALYERHRQRGGARAFSEGWQHVNARDLREWKQAVQWVKELGPPDCTIYPGPGGIWATIHFLSEQRVGKLHYRWRGLHILKSMVQWDAAMVLMQRHGATYEGVLAAMQEHPDCFERLRENSRAMLYRIHQPRLRQLVERLEAEPPTASP